MRKIWTDEAWDEYLYWQIQDKKTLKKINRLIQSIERDGVLSGEGHPERLKYRDGYSRKIDEKNRLVYDIEAGFLNIISCKGHYEDK